jgi:cathepsin D
MGATPTTPHSLAVDEDGHDYSYFSVIDFGSRNQAMWLLLDTGGSSTWVFGSNCTSPACLQHNTFGSEDSSTLNDTTTPWSVDYGSGYVTGVLASDSISFAGFTVNISFGLASNASDDFLNYPMDGILGLGLSSSSNSGQLTVMETMARNKLLESNIVGISLQRESDGTTDGEITFGGIDSSKYSGDITYTSVVANSNMWKIPVDGAAVNGKSTNLTDKSAIVDTGTSFILLPPEDAATLHSLIPDSTPSGSNFIIPCASTVEVEFTFSGVTYSVPPSDYVGSSTSVSGTCYSNIIGQQAFGPDDWLLGDVFLKNVYSIWDYDQKRIGFADRNATTPSTVAGSTSTATAAAQPGAASSTTGSPAGSTATNISYVNTAMNLNVNGFAASLTLLIMMALSS